MGKQQMRIYVAAPWINKAEAAAAAEAFEQAGFEITERWWLHPETTNHDELVAQAFKDVQGILDAQLMVVLQLGPSEGKAVETGIAMMAMVPVVVVNSAGEGGRGIGKAANLFQVLLPIVDSVDAAISVAGDVEKQYAEMQAEADRASNTPATIGYSEPVTA